MEDDTFDIMHLQIGTDAIEVAGHALQDDVAVAEEGIVVQFLPVGVEVRPAQLPSEGAEIRPGGAMEDSAGPNPAAAMLVGSSPTLGTICPL